MPIDIVIPRLGWNMDEAAFVGWLKQDGEPVRAGEPLFSLETDKAVQEVESMDSGRLQILPGGPQAGETVAVGLRIGRLFGEDEAGEQVGAAGSSASLAAAPENDRRPKAAQVEIHAETPHRPGRAGPTSTPRVRRKVRELGVDLHRVSGTGRGGRIRERDVAAALPSGTEPGERPAARAEDEVEVRPVEPTRRLIAERLSRSARETVPVTLTTSIDASNLVNLRGQFRAAAEARPGEAIAPIGYSDIVVKLAAAALLRHKILNSRWDGDRITVFHRVHVGLAVDTEYGLVVPVIRDASELTLRELAERSRALVDRARRRALSPEELQGGTFTVSNLGAFGIDAFTPIINHPECAILGMGRIGRPARQTARRRAAHRMTLSLTFDHRIVDGAPAARFLQELGAMIENPGPWLLP